MTIKEPCNAPGCQRKAAGPHGLCKACKLHVHLYVTFDKHAATNKRKTTPEQEAQIVRRLRKFEHPNALAREFGVSVRTIHEISKRAKP